MANMIVNIAVLSFLVGALVHGEVTVSFADNASGDYFKDGSAPTEQGELSREDLAATISSLLNIGALSRVDAATSEKVGRIVKASPFNKPEAIAVLLLAGLQTGSTEFGSAGVSQTLTVASKDSALEALAAVGQAGGVEHISLDIASLSGCGDICLETLLQESILGLGLDANYTPGAGSLKGKLSVRIEGEEVVLDLEEVADRLLSIELASTWRTSLDAAAEKRRRAGLEVPEYSQPQLIERALVSGQAMKDAYGADSAQYRVACCLLHKTVDFAVRQLHAAYNDRIAVVTVSLDSSEMMDGAKDLVSLFNWSTQSQRTTRSLLQAHALGDDFSIENFVAWIVMWGTFLLLLFFALSGCHCLRSMKFKQDSLLYGKNKTE